MKFINSIIGEIDIKRDKENNLIYYFVIDNQGKRRVDIFTYNPYEYLTTIKLKN